MGDSPLLTEDNRQFEPNQVVVGVGDDDKTVDNAVNTTKYETEIKQLKAQCADLNESVSAKDTEISSLNKQISDFKRQIEEKNVSENEKQNERINKLTNDLNE